MHPLVGRNIHKSKNKIQNLASWNDCILLESDDQHERVTATVRDIQEEKFKCVELDSQYVSHFSNNMDAFTIGTLASDHNVITRQRNQPHQSDYSANCVCDFNDFLKLFIDVRSIEKPLDTKPFHTLGPLQIM
ncbi:hypothetical protein HELRODRAFT_164110 [Helobdella robusta]|uniref:Uncharacterized protein n=1 Tax=Helobdella robusta TaxID=6412 RepID=T1EUY0_HELRO|nr:hypothetical protein HELRODRAFT_164110 [Helobdella robusta]ESN94295.1 hypothetical protein HELRODRAFT_164110 [Helobdella robusta]